MMQAPLELAPPLQSLAPLAEALGLTASDQLWDPPARAADTGTAHLMVRARDRGAVDRAEPNAEQLVKVLGAAGAEGRYGCAFDGRRSLLSVRLAPNLELSTRCEPTAKEAIGWAPQGVGRQFAMKGVRDCAAIGLGVLRSRRKALLPKAGTSLFSVQHRNVREELFC